MIILFALFRLVSGRSSSPSSTCPSMLGAFCPLWSHLCSEVSSCSTSWRRAESGVTCSNCVCPGDVQCFGGDCYALAFGVPAALMIVALGEFFPPLDVFYLVFFYILIYFQSLLSGLLVMISQKCGLLLKVLRRNYKHFSNGIFSSALDSQKFKQKKYSEMPF